MSEHHLNERELLKLIAENLQDQLRVLIHIAYSTDEILAILKPKPLTRSIAIRFTGATMQPNNTCVLTVGQTSQASILPLLADGVTPSGGVLSNVSYSFSDPSATVVINADGLTATVTGVAASASGPVAGSASCTVTDTDGAVSTWTQSFTILVNAAPPPQQLTQSVVVQFSDPTPSGAPPAGGAAPSLKAAKKPLNE